MANMFRMRAVIQDLIKYAKICGGDVIRLCTASGINTITYKKWKAESEEVISRILEYEEARPNGEYQFTEEEKALVVFYEKVVMEVARAEINQLEKVINDTDWRSGAWYLERTNPNQFARRRDIPNLDDFIRFVHKYFGPESREALELVWQSIVAGKEQRTTYDESEATEVNTRIPELPGQTEEELVEIETEMPPDQEEPL